jgi:hypothetical protein
MLTMRKKNVAVVLLTQRVAHIPRQQGLPAPRTLMMHGRSNS